MMETTVAYSEKRGGWVIVRIGLHGRRKVVAGPFPTQEEADDIQRQIHY